MVFSRPGDIVKFRPIERAEYDEIVKLTEDGKYRPPSKKVMFDLREFNTVDLRDANDLITPLAAAMAIGGGGQIIGASHARHKESNRIENTASMLSEFSIDVECTDDGLKILGGQHPNSPDGIVETMGDHRMQMAAVILATKVGAEIRGSRLHEVSFPEFLDYIQP